MTGREYPSVSFHAVVEINFLQVASTWVVAKPTYPVANISDIVIVELPPFVRFTTKQFYMVKGFDNAFDHMELCFVLSAEE